LPPVLPNWQGTGNNWVRVMNEEMFELMQHRRRLLENISAQRGQLAEIIGSHCRSPLLLADKGIVAARFLHSHPLLIIGVAAFFLIRRRSVPALVYGFWRIWKVYRNFNLRSANLLSRD
jgi:YqjK-like protein